MITNLFHIYTRSLADPFRKERENCTPSLVVSKSCICRANVRENAKEYYDIEYFRLGANLAQNAVVTRSQKLKPFLSINSGEMAPAI